MISAHAEQEFALNEGDALLRELSEPIPRWVIETLVQGAYIREYHMWEKDTKKYLNDQADWNGKAVPFKWKGDHMKNLLAALACFSVKIPDPMIDQINAIRAKVNRAKHDPGLLDEHLVTKDDLDEVYSAVEAFWQYVGENEVFTASL